MLKTFARFFSLSEGFSSIAFIKKLLYFPRVEQPIVFLKVTGHVDVLKQKESNLFSGHKGKIVLDLREGGAKPFT